jgi:hypothetical protein
MKKLKKLITFIYNNLKDYLNSIITIATIFITLYGLHSIQIIDNSTHDAFQNIYSYLIMIYFILIAILGIFIFKRALKKITKEKTIDIDIKISKNFELLTGILFIIILIASLISTNLQVTINTVMCLFYVVCRLSIIILDKVGKKNGKNIKQINK